MDDAMPLFSRVAARLRPAQVVFLCCAIFLSGPASASTTDQTATDAGPLRLTYTVYAGGITLVGADLEVAIGRDGYRVSFSARAAPLLDLFTRWSFRAEVLGDIDRNGPAPRRYDSSRQLRGRQQNGTLLYDGNGGVTASAVPPRSAEDRRAVPEAERIDTLDPLSAAIALMHTAERGSCTGSLPVFDGRRRYDIVMTPGGRDMIRPSRHAVYSGPALRCDIRLAPVAGFKDGDGSDFWDEADGNGTRRQATLWFAPIAQDAPPVPVRIDADSRIGPLVIRLSAAGRTATAER